MNMRKTGVRILVAIEVIVLIFVIALGVFGTAKNAIKNQGKNDNIQNANNVEEDNGISNTESDTATVRFEEERITFSEDVETKMSEMTIEEKVAQLFILTPEQYTGAPEVNVAGPSTKKAIEEHPIGGLAYIAPASRGNASVNKMLQGVQDYSNTRIGMNMLFMVPNSDGTIVSGMDPDVMTPKVIDPASAQENMTVLTTSALTEQAVSSIRENIDQMSLLMTESLSGDSITSQYSSGEAAVLAVQSGINLIYLPADFNEAYQAVLDGVNNGSIPMERIENSVGRIITMKMQ